MTRWIIPCLVAFSFISCARTYDRQAEFIYEEYASFAGEGTSRICGQAYLRVAGGKQYVASGDRLLLAPVTSYTEEAFAEKVIHGRTLADPDPAAVKFERHSKTDDDGRFCFSGLPAGEYYIVANIVLPASPNEPRESQLAHAKVAVKADENVYVLVTR